MRVFAWLFVTGLVLGARAPMDTVPSLPGTTWAASFYYYHEDWTFLSEDSVAISSGQWGWSMPLDPKLLSADSIYPAGREVVHYRMNGPLLIVERFPFQGEDTLTWDGQYFVSNWAYTYGNVVLQPGGDLNCHLHTPVH